MKIRVFSAVDANYAAIAAVTWPRIATWCRAFDYEFSPVTFERAGAHPSWKKLEVLDAGEDDDLLIWIDADIFVRDTAMDLSIWFPGDGIAFSSDLKGICAGFFMQRGSWARTFLRFVRWCGPVDSSANPYAVSFHEQDTMKALLKGIDSIRARVTLLPTEVVTNSESGACPASRAWAYHAWASNWLNFPKELDAIAQLLGISLPPETRSAESV